MGNRIVDDFIEVYEGVLAAETCQQIIAAFENSDKLSRGATAGGVNTRLKDSWDLSISKYAEWSEVAGLFNATMLQCLMRYVRKYTYLALAPTALYRKAADGSMTQLGVDDIRAMDDATLRRLVTHVFRPGDINVQRYFADEGGYPYWHSETSPKLGDMDNLHRVLLWTCYLNDDFDEGETEFLYQRRKITPRTGSLAIAPAGFTHTHRGNQPKRGNKYIATSWILFQAAEQLYAAPPNPA
ncbi:MAG: 2OG-Fe(II) oxygenase [Xanthomonadales bacterium]|nr:2OG-Fe(II) oxygenase [Xanthomonadales bacterium]MCC6595079.1 2OG-Fe(II) oxygenase [Rhodanobacteraceae bacterium]MDL1867865.1 2OG-Fe(II) oxygenase [Gammaproteobacteria bacterium PRO6]